MADEADLADQIVEDMLATEVRKIVAKAAPRYADECDLCGVELIEFRRQFGRCVECQERVEKKEKVGISFRPTFYEQPGDDEDE